MHCRKPDLILFTVIFIAILTLSVFSLDNDCPWGDDYAAYISEGISIADGYFGEQVKLNTEESADHILSGIANASSDRLIIG